MDGVEIGNNPVVLKRENHFRFDDQVFVDKELIDSVVCGGIDVIQSALSSGANLYCVDAQQYTLLFLSIREQKYDITEFLLKCKLYNLNYIIPTGDTALCYAIRFFKMKAIDLLLDYGADPNQINEFGDAPLILATCFPDHDSQIIVQKLLARGANPSTKDVCGHTALERAVSNRSVEVVEMLLRSAVHTNCIDEIAPNALKVALKAAYNDKLDDSARARNSAIINMLFTIRPPLHSSAPTVTISGWPVLQSFSKSCSLYESHSDGTNYWSSGGTVSSLGFSNNSGLHEHVTRHLEGPVNVTDLHALQTSYGMAMHPG